MGVLKEVMEVLAVGHETGSHGKQAPPVHLSEPEESEV